MFKQVTKALKNVAIAAVVGLLILAFAAWGVPEMRSFTSQAPLRVGDASFSRNEILSEFNREVTNRRIQSPDGFSREDAIAQGLPQQVINSIVTRSAIEQEAIAMGLTMPTDVVREILSTDERFQNPRTGKFDQEVIDNITREYQISPIQFRSMMQTDLLRGQLLSSLSQGSGAPLPMVRNLLLREYERRNVTYLTVTEEMAGIPEEPSPDALLSYYEDNKANYTAPEFRNFTVVSLRDADFADQEGLSEEELREFYDTNKARLYEEPELRTLYQITYDTEAEAQSAAAQLANGEPFEKLAEARNLPLDAVTFNEVKRDDILDPNVAEAAFAEGTSEGDIAGPVQGLFGFTVVQIAGIKPPEVQTFEDVRDSIEAQLSTGESRRKLFDAVEAIEEQRDTGATLAQAATAGGAIAQIYGPVDSYSFGSGGEIIADIPGDVIREAFALEEGDESEAIAYSDDSGYFFVAVDEVIDPAAIPYEDVAEEVEGAWRRAERERRISRTVSQIRETVVGGSSLADAAQAYNRAPLTEEIERRSEIDALPQQVVEQIFSADKGSIVTGVSGGAQVIAIVNDISFDTTAAASGQEFALRQYLGYQLDQELTDAYASAVRNDLGVRQKPDAIQSIFADNQ